MRILRNLSITVLVVAIIVPILCAIAFLFRASIMVNTGGPWIPKDYPDEVNRIRHPSGFSIIRPSEWRVRVLFVTDGVGVDGIHMDPGYVKYLRFNPFITVHKLETKPEVQDYSRISFGPYQGLVKKELQVGGSDTPMFHYEVLIQGQDSWYSIFYTAPNGSWESPKYTEVPAEIHRYLCTFRHSESRGESEEKEANQSLKATQ